MNSNWKGLCTFSVLLLFATSTVRPASAQTKESNNLGANLGVLNYEVTTGTAHCTSNYGPVTYTYYDFSSFSFVSAQGITQPIAGSTYWDSGIGGRLLTGSCPSSPYGPTIQYAGTGYTIYLTPRHDSSGVGVLSSQILVSGYVNPKYIVVGVIYAPPGHLSNVDYASSDLVSSTVTTKTSYTSGYTEGTTVMSSSHIEPFKGGTIDSSSKSSTSYSQSTTTTDSTSVTVQKTTSTSLTVPGPVCDYCGVDHDYDLIGIWLNAVQLFTLTNNGVVQPNGYGFSTYDQPGLDVYYVYVGELNGDLPVRSSTTGAFARSWAGSNNGFQYPPGQGPALTAQDKQSILKMDPYWNCTYKSAINDTADCAEPPSTTRFTQTTNVNFPYAQPAAGGQPTTKQYMWSYANTDSQGIDVTTTNTQTFGFEKVFGGSLFGLGYQKTLSQTWTNTYTYETSSQFTSTNTTTATANITGPPCTIVSGACSPMYPPPKAYNPITCSPLSLATAFGQGDSTFIYQDNLFGTFLIEPYGQ
jgi:hypothetical protein